MVGRTIIQLCGANLHVNSLELKHYNEPRKKLRGFFYVLLFETI